nr:putative pre-16S rRNA nuclease isoform X1 [Tanacetum cinerariifolium]
MNSLCRALLLDTRMTDERTAPLCNCAMMLVDVLNLLTECRDTRYMKPLNLFQDLLKIPAVERGRLLGFDVGDKYVGLAVSDFNNKVASPLSVLVRKKSNIGLMALDFQHL